MGWISYRIVLVPVCYLGLSGGYRWHFERRLAMRYVTRDQYERDLTSWENIQNTIRNMNIQARPPTIEELRSNYLLDNIVVQMPRTDAILGHGSSLNKYPH